MNNGQTRSNSIYLGNISSPFFRFQQTLKIKGSSHKIETKNVYFLKNVTTILIKFCEFIAHLKPNNVTLSAFPEKIPETGKIAFFSVRRLI